MPRRSARSTPSPRTTRAQTAAPQSLAPAPTQATGSPSTPAPDPSNATAGGTTTPETSTTVAGHDAGNAQTNGTAVQLSPDDEQLIRHHAILAALERGTPYREIAAEHHISIATLSKIARNMATLESGAVSKLMQSKALQALEAWELAMVKGAESGKHAPARDWLLHAKAIDPMQPDASNGAKVAIIIGQVGQPVSVDVAQVIDTTAVNSESE